MIYRESSGRGSLGANTDPTRFDNEKLPSVIMRARVLQDESGQPGHRRGNGLWVIVQLNSYDPSIRRRPVRHDIREVAVQGHKYAVEFLRLRDDVSVWCAGGKVVT